MDKKKILIGLGILAAAGIGFYFWNKSRKKNATGGLSGDEVTNEPDLKPETSSNKKPETSSNNIVPQPSLDIQPENPNTYRMGRISPRENGFHAVMLEDRPPNGTIKAKDNVKITGTSFDGTYKVSSVFIDSNNRVGGIFIPIKYTPTGKDDRTFQRIGLIEKI